MNERPEAMSEDDVTQAVVDAVQAALPGADISVIPDAGGFIVRVVSEHFASLPEADRRSRFQEHVPPQIAGQVHTWELLTESEAPWYGNLTTTAVPPPAWSTALDRIENDEATPTQITFASDLDQDLDSAPVVTFYSLKGGVGRSTALAAVARRLTSEHGLRVLCIDMDLEAPGLDTLFGISQERQSDLGVVAALLAYEFGADPSILDHVVPIDDNGRLFCMPAGRIDSTYAARLRSLEPEIWYRERVNALHRLIDDARDSTLRPDVVLIDSRTGVSPVAAPLLFDVSDMAVVCFHPHSQARNGTELLTGALLSSTTRRLTPLPLTPEPRFVVSPMPPGQSAPRLADRAKSWIDKWLEPFNEARDGTPVLTAEEITHVVPYNAEVSFSDTVTSDSVRLAPYARIADWILQIVPEPAPKRSLQSQTSESKATALAQLSFSTGTAEELDSDQFLQDYVVTRQVSETADPDTPLILGRKGTGKTALFRWLAAGELPGWTPVAVTTPSFRDRPDWSFGPDNYDAIDQHLATSGQDWGTFWQILIALAVYRTEDATHDVGAPHPAMQNLEPGDFAATHAVLEVLQDPMGALRCVDWLRKVDANGKIQLLLLFDGLDTAFGNTPIQRRRRSHAIAGLLAKQADLAPKFSRIRLKIFVRQDIWSSLRFENKSHFYGLSRRLQWEDQREYFKVVLKRAVHAAAFRAILHTADKSLVETDVASWTPQQVDMAWSSLVGERMRGERTAFTSNWVWNRLADGNGDHSPRSLLQLFAAALDWEREEEKRSAYDRSVLRPRSLALSLERVSEPALSALLDEEFQELRAVADALKDYGRTPISEDTLRDALSETPEDLITLAREAGLITLNETDDETRSFRVPDLYRWALSVTRRGPM
ncbi:tyrosine-protein kinase family protein [Streptomyces sp. DSM 41931]|uniref:tyrosine-protein kinase family protein n=1 Tax=Streptomyces sp. DSM 41931 TaxID=3418367 RepID=UPI003D061766